MSKKFSVKKSTIEGQGIYATVLIEKGEIICAFEGEKISIPELKRRYNEGKERICDPLQVSERRYLDLKKPYVYFNHSCEPSAGLIKSSTLISLREIRPSEEITFDYSTTEWTWDHFGKNKEWEMKCICGSKICRRTISQFPYLPKNLISEYLQSGILQDFIFRKAKKSKII